MWGVLAEGDIIDNFWSFTNREGGRGWCVGMISLLGKKVEVCRIHRTESGPLKLVLTRPTFWGKVVDHTQSLFFWL